MSTPDFATAENNQELAQEVSCLKSLLTLMLQAMGQADAGRVIIKMERQIAQMEDQAQAEVFSSTVKQIKQAYRQ
ncbi:DUF2594 family protein [Leclercia adecarboxylata]|jgi:hypothetical protein|uniref:DUF2594 family protein n=1 Tax=Leclercia adecarboxylata TaxID=83655 RepID=A0AAP9AFN1_9ENTR|nr:MULTISPECIES: DUF2594 family protein [Leclercia]MCG1033721.1 DUF2594 family protein [Bacillus amyloliquefaciens]NYU11144.1 hypothetical protein [Enterobacteriaceae bacterium CCUG 67584]POU77489.1 hypothetical protein C3370_03030 [Leclercia sp. LSNIH7]POU79944.1 hypothetical protein C3387_03030 [Leclercia sp. LSNIH6]POV36326.1 hypothetical protein C3388_03345 [Leclercia sp. LSNIH5]POW51049.1 hypothetical protein C3406_13100 [Leclercia sp. LSNIH8]POW68730.1 hypothetical protein C3389_03100 